MSASDPGVHGLRWGRNTVSGEMIRADLFARGTSPHAITIGKSRSGKTYGVSQALIEGYLDGTIDNLFVADTQSGFGGLTQLLGGEHIVVDGQESPNPFAIAPLPEDIRHGPGAEKMDPLETKVDEVTQFIVNTIRATEPNADVPQQILRLAVDLTYERAGITSTDLDSHAKESPTMEDFVDVLADIHESPKEFTHHEFEGEITNRVVETESLLNSMVGYLSAGQYSHLMGGGDWGLLDDDVRMAYVDMAQKRDSSDAEKSAEILLALSQIGQKIKRAEGRTVFLIDEAHVLLHSPAMIDWLQKAAREWARYDAALFFVSQSPEEFVRRREGVGAGEENKRQAILEQCATVQVYNVPKAKPETLREFGLNDAQIDAAKNHLTPGWAGQGFSNCLINFEDMNNWIELRVEAPPFIDRVLNYTPRDHGEFREYMKPAVDRTFRAEDEQPQITTETTVGTGPDPAVVADLTDITYIGPARADDLQEVGLETPADVREADPEEIDAAITGVGVSRARDIIAAAESVSAEDRPAQPSAAADGGARR